MAQYDGLGPTAAAMLKDKDSEIESLKRENIALRTSIDNFGAPIQGAPATDTPSALHVQVGGSHYKDLAIQPVEYIHKNSIGFIEGSAIKYLTRWRAKNGVEDLKKARHFIDLLIDFES